MPDPAAQTGIVTKQGQDPNSTVTPVVEQQPGQTVVDANIQGVPTEEELFGLPVKQKPVEEPKPAEQPTSQPVAQSQQATITPEQEKQALLDKIAELEGRQNVLTEFETNREAFIAKYLPAFAKESFNPTAYVLQKINEKYGVRDADGNLIPFSPDPQKALIPGTPDYQYAVDLENLKREAQSVVENANQVLEKQRQEGQARFNTSKQAVITKYGMTEDMFQTKVWSKLENMDNGKALELMADGLMLQEKLDTLTKNIQNGVDRTQLPGVTEIGAPPSVTISEQRKAENELFGEKHVNRAYKTN